MTREKRLRRCLLLCCHFARNLAYYHARRMIDPKPSGDFWISVDANFIDMAVLEWCKIFGDNKAKQSWRNIVNDHDSFHAGLLIKLKMEAEEWNKYVSHVRCYRDKFLAHLDSDLTMEIPILEKALKSAKFYYSWILDSEFGQFDRKHIPPTLGGYYTERLTEAKGVYNAVSVGAE